MKPQISTVFLLLLFPALLMAEDEAVADKQALHKEGSAKVADKQDELSADVQQLTIEQTVPEVIELLNDVEKIMDEATDRLAEQDTGGDTIAAQTEIIERIHDAAKEKKKQSDGSESGSALMDMMERMMGKKPDGDKPGEGKDGKPGDKGGKGGKGVSGLSDTGNDPTGGQAGGKSEARRVPKAAGTAGHALPEEFRKALDAYNRGAEQKVR